MVLRDDFLEMNLYLEDYEDDDAGVSVWVHCRNRDMLVFHNVRHNPVRYEGRWVIDHEFIQQRATSYLPSDEVWYFTVIGPRDNRPAEPTVPNDTDLAVAEVEADLYLTDEVEEVMTVSHHDDCLAWTSGYLAALDAAEAAVAELTEKGDSVRPADVMVAIRALKEKP